MKGPPARELGDEVNGQFAVHKAADSEEFGWSIAARTLKSCRNAFVWAGEVFDDLEGHRCTGRIAREVDIAAEEAHDGVTLDVERDPGAERRGD
jgi:hypothetical protein